MQTYGSGNLKRVGVILQRGILILSLACFPCWAILINTEPLLLAVKQSPEVARSVTINTDTLWFSLLTPFVYTYRTLEMIQNVNADDQIKAEHSEFIINGVVFVMSGNTL